MCNLYPLKAGGKLISDAFAAERPVNFNASEGDVYRGAPGMVVREDGDARIVQSMTWGIAVTVDGVSSAGGDRFYTIRACA